MRTDRDFCRLVELRQVFDTLVGDDRNLYDVNTLDDQLVLGIKGTLSVVELKVIRMRLLEGAYNKAARGDLYRLLPPGYVFDGAEKPVKDPDLRIREAIDLRCGRCGRKVYVRYWGAAGTSARYLCSGNFPNRCARRARDPRDDASRPASGPHRGDGRPPSGRRRQPLDPVREAAGDRAGRRPPPGPTLPHQEAVDDLRRLSGAVVVAAAAGHGDEALPGAVACGQGSHE